MDLAECRVVAERLMGRAADHARPDAAERLLIVIPCLNEAAHLPGLLDDLAKDPAAAEARIVVVDGGSADESCAVARAFAQSRPRAAVLHNPKRIQSAGVNLAVERFGDDADFILRIDAHGLYPSGFIGALLEARRASGADAVAVSMRARAHGGACFERAAAAAQNSRLGTGGSPHRAEGPRRWVDHGHHALIGAAAFRAVGGYDEAFTHNEDAELDARLTAHGAKILLAADIVIDYFPRATPGGLFRQYFNHGRGRARTFRRHGALRLRQAAPLLVAPAVFALALAPFFPWAALPCAAWLAGCLMYGAVLGVRERSLCAGAAGIAAAIMHLAWSLGFWAQAGARDERRMRQSETSARAADGRYVTTLALALFAFARLSALFLFPIYDDAYITFRHAANIAEGVTPFYTVGEPLLATTSPVFMLILAAFGAAGVPLEWAARALGLAADLGVLLFSFRLIDAVEGFRRTSVFGLAEAEIGKLFFAIAWCVQPQVNRVAVGGLESSLFLLAVLLAFASAGAGRPSRAAGLAGLSYFVRPEGALAGLIAVARAALARRWREAALMAALGGAVFAAGVALIWSVYGAPLSFSLVAKSGWPGSSLSVLVRTLAAPDLIGATVSASAILFGATLLRVRLTAPLTMLASFTALYAAGFMIVRPYACPWYGYPVFYAAALFAGLGAARAATAWKDAPFLAWAKHRTLALAPALAAAALTAAVASAVLRTHYPYVQRNLYGGIAAWCASHAPETIAAYDVGAIGYHCRTARIIDLIGLVSLHRAQGRSPASIIRAARPEFLFVNETKGHLAVANAVGGYRPILLISEDGARTISSTSELAPADHWVQRYVLFARAGD
jgi:succinoglycan biosynthesis protein ExoA